MDSAELLDLLGNGNRRRILRLLARKPCYVTEISEYLGVSPKAVIDHLRKLEEAGLVESRTDDRRRKYFSISRNLRLEVNVSPYEFGTKSAYPASSGVDMASCRYLSIEIETEETSDLSEMAATLRRLEKLENELSLAQRWVQGRLSDVRFPGSQRGRCPVIALDVPDQTYPPRSPRSRRLDLLPRVNAEESRHGISGRVKRPVGFKTHAFHASPAGFQHRHQKLRRAM